MEEQKEEKTQLSFLKKVSADAWVLALAIIIGSLFITAAVMPPKGASKTNGAADNKEQAVAPAPAKEIGETTIDNDPVLGDKTKAKVAIVEFSDLECPFCKKFHEESAQKLIDKYVTSGQAIWVSRDLPLPFHDPVATTYAGIANCVFQEKGANAYYTLTKEMYKNTLTNGKGVPQAKLDQLLTAAGVNAASVKACAEKQDVKDEIAADIEAASSIGIEGTPSFVVGKLDDKGNVKGEVIVGAQPFATFEKTVEKYLK
jgi:protein-disulfide isomerase